MKNNKQSVPVVCSFALLGVSNLASAASWSRDDPYHPQQRRACLENHIPEFCASLASVHLNFGEKAEAQQLLDTACQWSRPLEMERNCASYLWLERENDGISFAAQQEQLLSRCGESDAQSCLLAGLNQDGPMHPTGAARFSAQEFLLEFAMIHRGRLSAPTATPSPAEKQRQSALEKACTYGNLSGCLLASLGRGGTSIDTIRLASLCDKGLADACVLMAEPLRAVSVQDPDENRKREQLRLRACESGDTDSCRAQDALSEKTLERIRIGCAAGHYEACRVRIGQLRIAMRGTDYVNARNEYRALLSNPVAASVPDFLFFFKRLYDADALALACRKAHTEACILSAESYLELGAFGRAIDTLEKAMSSNGSRFLRAPRWFRAFADLSGKTPIHERMELNAHGRSYENPSDYLQWVLQEKRPPLTAAQAVLHLASLDAADLTSVRSHMQQLGNSLEGKQGYGAYLVALWQLLGLERRHLMPDELARLRQFVAGDLSDCARLARSLADTRFTETQKRHLQELLNQAGRDGVAAAEALLALLKRWGFLSGQETPAIHESRARKILTEHLQKTDLHPSRRLALERIDAVLATRLGLPFPEKTLIPDRNGAPDPVRFSDVENAFCAPNPPKLQLLVRASARPKVVKYLGRSLRAEPHSALALHFGFPSQNSGWEFVSFPLPPDLLGPAGLLPKDASIQVGPASGPQRSYPLVASFRWDCHSGHRDAFAWIR